MHDGAMRWIYRAACVSAIGSLPADLQPRKLGCMMTAEMQSFIKHDTGRYFIF